jgi:predicted nucleic acid-binding Zn ribbon protein
MINCPKCGTAVREGKAFCHNCGSPMDAAKAARETPLPDFGATVLEPPRRPAPSSSTFVPPAVTEVQPPARPPAPVSYPPAGVALPTPPGAPPAGRRKSRKIAFVLLVLFLMFLAFVLAIVLD